MNVFDEISGEWVAVELPMIVEIERIANAMVKLTDKVEELYKAVAKLEARAIEYDNALWKISEWQNE